MTHGRAALIVACLGLAGCGTEVHTCDAAICPRVTFPARDYVCAAGASPPCPTTEPAQSVVARTVEEPGTLPGSTLTYVISAFALPQASLGVAAGFNLDRLHSGMGSTEVDATCEEFVPDFASVFEHNHVGVDNSLQGLIGSLEGELDYRSCPGGVTDGCVDWLLAQQIAAGDMLHLVEIGDVNDLSYDSSVTVQLFTASVSGGGSPAVNSDGILEPGQSFDAVALGAPRHGDIFAGRVRGIAETFAFSLDVGRGPVPIVVRSPELRFDITMPALENGQLGGRLPAEEVIVAGEMLAPGYEGTVRALVEQIADLDPGADPTVCSAVSMGAAFSAVVATRNP